MLKIASPAATTILENPISSEAPSFSLVFKFSVSSVLLITGFFIESIKKTKRIIAIIINRNNNI